jgi:ER degradation enhancer, mannosidase alpha-like 2
MKPVKTFLAIFCLALIFSLFTSHKVNAQYSEKQKEILAEKVKSEFLYAWNAYKKYAWGHDALTPLSKSFHDWYTESLLMTPVDAYDTMLLMGLKDEAAEAKKLILEKLSFDKDMRIQNFEVVIRLLGGLISAYEWDGDVKFLNLAQDLADRLMPVFNSPTGMPYGYINLKTGKTDKNISNPAEIGTLFLEFGMLSKLTGKPVYYEKSKKAVVEVYNRRSKIGLVGSDINIETGEWVNKESHISGGIDSYYEYLIKGYMLFGDKDMKKMYDESMKAVNKYLWDEKDGRAWYCVTNMETGEKIAKTYGSLDAFMPAMLSLGGDLKRAKELQRSNFFMWTLYGIEPEQFNYANNQLVYRSYALRPENIESAYYLYKYTKEDKYLMMVETYFETLIKYCKCDAGYAHLKDVETKEKSDKMESFFLAETFKYLYLTFAKDSVLDFNKVIFNTEAHPLKKAFVKSK